MAEQESRIDYVDSYEDVSMFHLDSAREDVLLSKQTECTFMWTTAAGEPVGVIMNFVFHEGRFWVTCTRRRKRVSAVEKRPRVALAISSRGTDIGISQTVTYKGNARVLDDAATAKWFYPANEAQVAFVEHLESPGRVVIEIVPDQRIGFDAEEMFRDSPAGPSRSSV